MEILFDFTEFYWNDQRGIDEVCEWSILATIALDFFHFILGIVGGHVGWGRLDHSKGAQMFRCKAAVMVRSYSFDFVIEN